MYCKRIFAHSNINWIYFSQLQDDISEDNKNALVKDKYCPLAQLIFHLVCVILPGWGKKQNLSFPSISIHLSIYFSKKSLRYVGPTVIV